MRVATSYALDLHASYRVVKYLLEVTALDYHQRNPWLHLADACTLALRAKPCLWTVYCEAMQAGLSSEFQKPRKVRTRRDELWMRVENAGRERVARSEQPITLRQAVIEIVQTPEGKRWYREYARAPRR